MKARLNLQEYVTGILQGDRVVLAKAITLIESTRSEDRALADRVLETVLPHTGKSLRIGITGVPGVGKSTFIEAFGKYAIEKHKKKVAVLTVDPSSSLTKGSILGDKTRMETLAKHPMAFIRPSATGEALGGIAHRTREALHLCEAAGFDFIIVETVGVGQSEVAVKNIVDFFLLLMLAGAGDELQGIKKGIMEMADAIAITKADGDNVKHAREAQAEYQHAFHVMRTDDSGWSPKVLTCSSLTMEGIDDTWNTLSDFEKRMKANGYFETRRQHQQVSWMHECFESLIKIQIEKSARTTQHSTELEQLVLRKVITPQGAAATLFQTLLTSLKNNPS
ncbi:MAG: methylmalonyl Co-A mutase-associated GTPase MeaB [Cyclobacteriaceae bacterium]|nr:methylmalonyl Co-A mutase-associated GTPase MeaB [Cyclobacteriaceae bacterium]